MIPINNQIKIMNTISSGLCQDVIDLREGRLSIKQATAISRISGKAIRSISDGAMLANHQEIQREKVKAGLKRTEAINRNTEFKFKKLDLFKVVG
tara:strand:+ start:1243 stop:1527 length:285 start_codon:yes stop_codon:yes gene_type:complete